MTDRPVTIGEAKPHAATLAAMAAALLTGLASGKYDPEVALTEHALADLGIVFPAFAAVEKGLEFFLALNRMTAGRGPVVADGKGGYVTKSWVDDPRHQLNPDGTFKEL